MATITTTVTIMAHKPPKGGRRMVRDARLRPPPHHEAEQAPAPDPRIVGSLASDCLILRSPAQPGVSKDEGPPASSLYRLMTWLSPSYPVGAFSYSSGIEFAVENGDIRDAASLQAWIATIMTHGSGGSDAVLFVHVHRAIETDDDKALHDVAELAAAFVSSRERHLETTAQGRAFVDATRAAWPCDALDRFAAIWEGPVAYPVAVAAACAGHDIALDTALPAFLQAVAANLVSAGVRLIPLGQTDGQRVLAALAPVVAETAERAMRTALTDIGSATFRADIASMRHETQYTRLFRS
jgi:urease accessory protein